MPAKPEFDSLIAAHSAALLAYLWRLLRDPQAAEDCLQETFLRAFRAYPRLGQAEHVRAWLYRIATNTAMSTLRQSARLAARTADLAPDVAAPEPGPSEQVAQAQLLAAVARAVAGLPPQQHAALVLRKYQGLSYAEVAAALGCTPEAARANVYQALKRLRAELAQYGGSYADSFQR